MKKVLLFFAFILTFNFIFAGTTGKISGTITDAANGEPLIGVNVIIEGTNYGAATDVEGFYSILNVLPGSYTVKASYLSYNTIRIEQVRVNIDQTTQIDIQMTSSSIELEEAVIVAVQPIVQKDVSSSTVNLNADEIKSLPVVSAQSVIGYQAGIKSGVDGPIIRGGSASETGVELNGMSLRDERNNVSYIGVSYTAVDEIQVLTGGFNAEYGNIRSGMVKIVTKEGDKHKYNVSLLSRISPPAQKSFGNLPTSYNSYWIRPYIDPAVMWTGTSNGAWDEYTQSQYQEFRGWNKVSEETLSDDDPSNDLTPDAARQLFLWQHRKQVAITQPDYSYDMTVTGPVPGISKYLGNLRFLASYRASQSMYLVPLSDDAYRDWNFQFKLTSDIGKGMKLSIDGLWGQQTGTTSERDGSAGIFNSNSQLAADLDNRSGASYLDARVFATDYWAPTKILRNAISAKFTHAINEKTFYEAIISSFRSKYSTNPGDSRNTSLLYDFGGYLTDESPYGYYSGTASGIGSSMNMGLGFSNSRDTSRVTVYTAKFDLSSQLDKYNFIKTGFEFVYTDNNVNYALVEPSLPSNNSQSVWHTFPIRGAVYIQDKLEFEAMIANIGVRIDYSSANGEWYVFDPFNTALSGVNSLGIDTLLLSQPADAVVSISPRLGIAFPISVNSKLFFNYGHFRSMPVPEELYLLRRNTVNNQVTRIANPNNPLPKTITYELGYEHNLFDEYLISISGYYKDISEQPRSVRYTNRDNSVSYLTPEPNNYRDIRGFEISLKKNRGKWFRGFINYTYEVTSSGNFGLPTYYENPALQREEERNISLFEQNKPVPQPYARANIEFFTPSEYGPKYLGVNWFGNWSVSLLGVWSAGPYFSWTGPGGTVPGYTNNIQWADFYNADLRISKGFDVGPLNMEFFMDIYNFFNIKYLSYRAGFADANDFDNYMKSLHLPDDIVGQFNYGNVNGDDQPGDWNADYIDQPNFQYLGFLNPRDIYFGFRFTVDL